MFMCRWILSCKVPVSFSSLLSNSFVIFKPKSWAVEPVGDSCGASSPLSFCALGNLRCKRFVRLEILELTEWSTSEKRTISKLLSIYLFHTFTVPPLCLALEWHVRVMTDLWLQSCWVHICRDFHSHDAVGTLHLQGFSRWTAWRVKCGLGLSTLSMFAIFWSRLRRGHTRESWPKADDVSPIKLALCFSALRNLTAKTALTKSCQSGYCLNSVCYLGLKSWL